MASETDLLRELLLPPLVPLPAGTIGPGDDACVLPADALRGGRLVVSCDALEEGVHFRAGWLTLGDLAHKLLAVSLSDVAAMGAEPIGVLVGIAWDGSSAGELGLAMQQACAAAACPLLGGDTDVRQGPLRLEATVLARCDRPLLRSGGRAGDALFVTGPLGGAALCVAAWESGTPLDERDPAAADALRRFRRPVPRLDAARVLCGTASACIDLSDGLRADAAALAAASGLACRIDRDSVPVHPALPAGRRGLALDGGEDYELLLAGPVSMASGFPGLVRVGELTKGPPGEVTLR